MPSSSSSPPSVAKKSYKDALKSSPPAKADKQVSQKKQVSSRTLLSLSVPTTMLNKNPRSKSSTVSRINLMPLNKKKATTVSAQSESNGTPIKPAPPSSIPSTPEPPTWSPSPPPSDGPSPPPTPPLPELPDLKETPTSTVKKPHHPHDADSYIGIHSLVQSWIWVKKGNGRKSREKVRGVVIKAAGKRQWVVQFDGGDTCVKHSNSLR